MVAPNRLARFFAPFYGGQPVRLLVAFVAWRAIEGTTLVRPNPDVYTAGGHDGPSSRTLSPKEPLRFLRTRDKPGSCLVTDATGAAWICPIDFLTAGAT